MGTGAKGTISNPYTMAEFEELADAGLWQGGFVIDDGGNVTYTMAELTVTGYSGYSGDGSDGSDYDPWGSDPWGSDDGDGSRPWDDDGGDDDDKEGGGREMGDITGTDSGGTISGGGSGTGNFGGLNSKQIHAINIIEQLERSISTVSYPNVNKASFISKLREQIIKPAIIRQGQNGTCGIAVICKYLAECMPDKYVEAAISLYTTGKFEEWKLKVCEASKTGSDAQAAAIGTTSLDCIIQGAFRNTYNYILDYNPFTDGSGVSSITIPADIFKFFKNTLGKNVRNIFDPDYLSNNVIDYNNNFVIALIDIKEDKSITNYYNKFYFGNGLIPDHYVQILSRGGGDSVLFWQWGKEKPFISKTSKCHQLYIIEK